MGSDLPEESHSPLDKYKLPLIAGSLGLLLILIGVRVATSQTGQTIEFVENTASTAAHPTELIIDVSGAVENPGVYKLTSSSRIQDALLAAGGLSADADRTWVSKHMNLAGKLIDGAKVYVPQVAETISNSVLGITSGQNQDVISINSASASQLESLPGIGEVTAQKIITLRPYSSL